MQNLNNFLTFSSDFFSLANLTATSAWCRPTYRGTACSARSNRRRRSWRINSWRIRWSWPTESFRQSQTNIPIPSEEPDQIIWREMEPRATETRTRNLRSVYTTVRLFLSWLVSTCLDLSWLVSTCLDLSWLFWLRRSQLDHA